VIRASQTNTISVLFGSSKRQKCKYSLTSPCSALNVVRNLTPRLAAFKDLRDHIKNTSSSDIGPHLSAHNAVKVPFRGASTYRNTRDLYVQHVERRRRAQKRANWLVRKHENGPPPKEQHYDHWGYPYVLAGPWVCPLFFDQSMYTSSISNPLPGSGVNADDNIGGCATGCGYLAHCGSSNGSGGRAVLDAAGIIADVFDVSNDGGGDGGGKLQFPATINVLMTDNFLLQGAVAGAEAETNRCWGELDSQSQAHQGRRAQMRVFQDLRRAKKLLG
jgi:hypothetical protein